jgi:hypothetical protein
MPTIDEKMRELQAAREELNDILADLDALQVSTLAEHDPETGGTRVVGRRRRTRSKIP